MSYDLATITKVGLVGPELYERIYASALASAVYDKAAVDAKLGDAAIYNKATVSEVRLGTSNKLLTSDIIIAALAWVTLTDAATVDLNWGTFINSMVTVTANRALGNPTNVQLGTFRTVLIKGSSSTERTISYPSYFKGDLPTQTVTNTSWLLISMFAVASDHLIITSAKAL